MKGTKNSLQPCFCQLTAPSQFPPKPGGALQGISREENTHPTSSRSPTTSAADMLPASPALRSFTMPSRMLSQLSLSGADLSRAHCTAA